MSVGESCSNARKRLNFTSAGAVSCCYVTEVRVGRILGLGQQGNAQGLDKRGERRNSDARRVTSVSTNCL